MLSDDPSVLKSKELYSTLESTIGDLTNLPMRMSGESKFGEKYALAVDRPFEYGNKVLLRFAHGKSLGKSQSKRPFWGKEMWGKPLYKERNFFFVYVDLEKKLAQAGTDVGSFLNHKELNAMRPPSSLLNRVARRFGYKVERVTKPEHGVSEKQVDLKTYKLKAKNSLQRLRLHRMQEGMRRLFGTYPFRIVSDKPDIPAHLQSRKPSILGEYIRKSRSLEKALYGAKVPPKAVDGGQKLSSDQQYGRCLNLIAQQVLRHAQDSGLTLQDEGPRRQLFHPENKIRSQPPSDGSKPSKAKSKPPSPRREPKSPPSNSESPQTEPRPPFTLRSVESDGKYSTIMLWTGSKREVSIVLPNNTHAWKALLSESLHNQATEYLNRLGKQVARPEVDIDGMLSRKNHTQMRHQPDQYPDFKVLRRFSNRSGKPLTKHGEHYAIQHKGGPSYFAISDARPEISKHLLSEQFQRMRLQTPLQQQSHSELSKKEYPKPTESTFPKRGKNKSVKHRNFQSKPPRQSYGGR